MLIPCLDEAATIGKVIDDFRAALPAARIVVFDNASTDRTAAIATERGAEVILEPRRGKGYVVEAMFSRVEADLYVMVDGDDTYPADHVEALLSPLIAGEADMVVGARLKQGGEGAFRPFHMLGNLLVRGLINRIFGARLSDILSGYRAYNRRVVEQVPVVASGFEVETELTIQALYHRLSLVEVQVPYRSRPEGSHSKLNTFRDGWRVLWTIFSLFRETKPLTFFGLLAILLFAGGVAAGVPPVMDYVVHRYVYRVPLAILATGLMILSCLSLGLGIVLHAVNWRFKELHNVLTRPRRR